MSLRHILKASLFALVALSVSLCAYSTAHALSYAVNFNGTYQGSDFDVTNAGGPLGPYAANQTNWNNFNSGGDVNFGPFDFSFIATNNAGAVPVMFFFNHSNSGGKDGGGAAVTNFDRLFNSGERSDDGVATVTSTSLIPFATYDVYAYGDGGYTANGNSEGAFAPTGGFTNSNTHYFPGLSGPLTLSRVSGNTKFSGFSIVDTSAPPAPAINVEGNAMSVANNDATPSVTDGTDFGSTPFGTPVDHTFVVENPGTAPLLTSGLVVPAGYSIVDGLDASIAGGGMDSFIVRLLASASGVFSGNVSFNTNVPDSSLYSFAITGNVGAAPSSVPEPASLAIWAMLGVIGLVSCRLRSNKS